jgi:signal transduction histidine kinase
VNTVTIGHEARRRWQPPWVDVALAAAVAVVQIGATAAAAGHQTPHRELDAFGVTLLAVASLALALRRRFPRGVYAVVFATSAAYWAIGYPRGPIFLALIIAFGTVMFAGYRVFAWASLVVGYAAFMWLGALFGTQHAPGVAYALGIAAWLLVLGSATEIVRIRRERAADAARARQEEQRRRASDERLRIARELHDVVAHNLSLINVQAGTALHLIHEHPEHAEGALTAIKQASKDALDELRSVVDVLRATPEDAPRGPTPTLADLESLIERTASAGIRVELRVDGTPRPLPVPVETAAYRVTQEALTNVARHAGAAHTVVQLSYLPDALVVQVDDDGRDPDGAASRPPSPGTGKGLTGMRERLQALGGRLEAGPRRERGFRVRAWIPADSPS